MNIVRYRFDKSIASDNQVFQKTINLFLNNYKFIFEKLDCHLQYLNDTISNSTRLGLSRNNYNLINIVRYRFDKYCKI
jgi:hypothetical protein